MNDYSVVSFQDWVVSIENEKFVHFVMTNDAIYLDGKKVFSRCVNSGFLPKDFKYIGLMPEDWDRRGRLKVIHREGKAVIIAAHPDMKPKEYNPVLQKWEDI